MTARISTALVAATFGLAALVVPAIGNAADVGYYGSCWGQYPVTAITAAGHTPVAVATPDAATLATLDALMVGECTYSLNAAINAAVATGMVLVIHDWGPNSGTAAKLPGAPGVAISGGGGSDMDLPVGSPITNGPGGVLTNSSLDGGSSSYHGKASLASLPVNGIALTTTTNPNEVVTFSYPYGTGRVVYGAMPLDAYLPGADLQGNPAALGMQAYITNVVAWAVPRFISCAAEGFAGAKLTLCRQVCEIDQTPTKLTSLIKLYMSTYRTQPPCAN